MTRESFDPERAHEDRPPVLDGQTVLALGAAASDPLNTPEPAASERAETDSANAEEPETVTTATEYDLAERAEEQRIAALARALVTELGDAWSVKPAEDDGRMHYGRLIGPQGMALYIHGAGWAGRGRLSVTGDYPRRDSHYYGPREDRAKATIAAERAQGDTLTKAAREIVSRMFNVYREQYAKALAEAEAHDAYQSKAEANAAKIRAVLGDTGNYDGRNGREPRSFYVNMTGHTYGSGDASDDSVRFDRLSTSVSKALRIAKILAEPEPEK